MRYQVLVCWDRSSANHAAEYGLEDAQAQKNDQWCINEYNFDTKAEMGAFCLGIGEANGWDSPYWEQIEL